MTGPRPPAAPADPVGGFGPGVLGKVPAVGDFVRAGLPRAFVDPWDALLADAVDLCRRRHGRDWGGVFLGGPAWRFALEPGVCGPAAVAGLLLPSADRVGRPYPLMLAATLPAGAGASVAPFACDPWFDAAEGLARRALDGGLGQEGLTGGLAALGRPVPDAGFLPALCRKVIEERAGFLPAGFALWWTVGSGREASAFIASAGLPAVDRMASMLDGGWHGWTAGEEP